MPPRSASLPAPPVSASSSAPPWAVIGRATAPVVRLSAAASRSTLTPVTPAAGQETVPPVSVQPAPAAVVPAVSRTVIWGCPPCVPVPNSTVLAAASPVTVSVAPPTAAVVVPASAVAGSRSAASTASRTRRGKWARFWSVGNGQIRFPSAASSATRLTASQPGFPSEKPPVVPGLRSRAHAELAVGALEVLLNRALADAELVGDVAVALTGGHAAHDLRLAGGESVGGEVGGRQRRCCVQASLEGRVVEGVAIGLDEVRARAA